MRSSRGAPALPHRNPNAAPARRPKRRRLQRSRRDWIVATLVELDPIHAQITIRVESGGRPLPAPGEEVTVDVSSARIRATDGDGDGRAGLTDLFPGDRVRVSLRSEPRRTPVAWRIRQESPGASPGGLRPIWGV